MMAEYVTFAPKDDQGALLHKAVISVIDDQNEILLTDSFGVFLETVEIRTVQLEPGTYSAWVRADGYIFPFPLSFTVNLNDGPLASTPLVVDFTATGSSVEPAQSTSGWCRVFGHTGLDSPSGGVGRAASSYGVVEESQFGTRQVMPRDVVFWRVGPQVDGELTTLQRKERIEVAVDRNGYFEVLLVPETLYSVDLPNVTGRPFILTPAAGLEADVLDLVDASRVSSPYDLIGGS